MWTLKSTNYMRSIWTSVNTFSKPNWNRSKSINWRVWTLSQSQTEIGLRSINWRVWTLSQSQTEIDLRSINWRVWTLSQSKLASIRESIELNRKTKSKMRWWRDIFKEISRFTQKGLNMTDKFSWWLKDLLVQTTE